MPPVVVMATDALTTNQRTRRQHQDRGLAAYARPDGCYGALAAAVHFSSPRAALPAASRQRSPYVICALCFSTSFKSAHVHHPTTVRVCVGLGAFCSFLVAVDQCDGLLLSQTHRLSFCSPLPPPTVPAARTETSQMPLLENSLLCFIRLLMPN